MFDISKCVASRVTEAIAEKIIRLSYEVTISSPDAPSQNVILCGGTGIGKTSMTKDVCRKLLGPKIKNEEFFQSPDGKNIGFIELHGATTNMLDVTIPHIVRKRVTKENMNKWGIQEAPKMLGVVTKEFFELASLQRADVEVLFIMIQDANKNPQEEFNGFLKSLADGRIGNKILPKTFMVITCNPPGGEYVNKVFDPTLLGDATVLNMELSMEEAAFWCSDGDKVLEKVFLDHPKIMHYNDEKGLLYPKACPRNWRNAVRMFKYASSKEEYMDCIPYLIKGKVGESEAMIFLEQMNIVNRGFPLDYGILIEKIKEVSIFDFPEYIKFLLLQSTEYSLGMIYTLLQKNEMGESKFKSFLVSCTDNPMMKKMLISSRDEGKKEAMYFFKMFLDMQNFI